MSSKVALIHSPAIEAVKEINEVQDRWTLMDTLNLWGLIYKAVKNGHGKDAAQLLNVATEQVRRNISD